MIVHSFTLTLGQLAKGEVTLDDLSRPNVVFHCGCAPSHLLGVPEGEVPMEVPLLPRSVAMRRRAAELGDRRPYEALAAHSMGHRQLTSAAACHPEDVLLWQEFSKIINQANREGRVFFGKKDPQ